MKKVKKVIKLLPKKTIALLLLLSLTLNYFSPVVKVFAATFGEGDIILRVGIDSNEENFEVDSVTVNESAWNDNNDEFKTDDGQYRIVISVKEKEGLIPDISWGGNFSNYINKTYTYNNGIYTYTLDVDNSTLDANYLSLMINASNNGVGSDNNPGENNEEHHGGETNTYNGNKTSTLNFKVTGNIEYRDFNGNVPTGVSFRINDITYRTNNQIVYTEEEISTYEDGSPVMVFDDNEGKWVAGTEIIKTGASVTNDTIKYDVDNTNKVTFTFLVQWNDIITNLKINGQSINSLPKTNRELGEAYKDHCLEIEVKDIEAADIYNIEIEVRKQNDEEIIMGNFLWDYNEENGYTSKEDKIAHAKLTFVEATYNGHTYKTEKEINELGGLFNWKDAERKNKYTTENEGVGEAQFPVGTELTVKLIPDAGYQLVEFGINDGVFETEDEIGTYTFTIEGGNFHLQAKFEAVEDVVNSKSEKIDSGTVVLGEEESMSIGTARLDVEDIELTKDQISNFEKAADGYEISDYIDISLYNTVYKGSSKSSWDTEVKELENEAKVTLKLEDNVNGKEVAIVHEKHDGTYEIIETEYNEEDNTITFTTKSFSNYAIATKNIADNKVETSPKTLDNIMTYIGTFIISSLGLLLLALYMKKKNN